MDTMNFNWNRVNVYHGAKASDVGSIRVSFDDQSVIALRKYGSVTWEPLNTLSGSMWKQYRTMASGTINDIFKDGEKIEVEERNFKQLDLPEIENELDQLLLDSDISPSLPPPPNP